MFRGNELTDISYDSYDLSVISSMDGGIYCIINNIDFRDYFKSNVRLYSEILANQDPYGTYISSSGYIDEDAYAIIQLSYDLENADESSPGTFLYYQPFVLLGINRGELVDVEFEKGLGDQLTNITLRSSNLDNRIYFFISEMDKNYKPINLKLAYIDKDMGVKIESNVDVGIYNNLKIYDCTYIKKGGWYSD